VAQLALLLAQTAMGLLDCYNELYNTDDVSVNSTASSVQHDDGMYTAETVLSEGYDEETNQHVYLIKWLGYDIHR
jgi:hypothetical protein